MNAHFWHAVLSVPDDDEADRMLDMLELYERQQQEDEEDAYNEYLMAQLRKANREGRL